MRTTQPRGCLSVFSHTLRLLCQRYAPCIPTRPLISFIPGEICLLAEVQGNPSREQVVELLRKDLDQRNLSSCVRLSPRRVVLVPGARRTLAVATAVVPEARTQPRRLLQLVREINRQLPPLPLPQQPPTAQQYSNSTPDLTAAREQAEAVSLRLQIAAPNWLMSSTPKNTGGGGPGAWPVPYLAPVVTAEEGAPPANDAPWPFTLPEMGASGKNQQPTLVDVVVLDTAPTTNDIDDALAEWPNNALLQQLAGPGGALRDTAGNLRIYPALASHLLGLVDVELDVHSYVMSDHGLFVAGIVNAIAPDARLHLVEVLNPYGVGSLESIAAGFAQATTIARNRTSSTPLLVNLSLVLNMPANEALLDDLQDRVSDLAGFTVEDIPLMSALLAQLCNLLQESNVVLVAAAGNDGNSTSGHPNARFPAAFNNVVGVGALRDASNPAEYSNQADRPQSVGIATFGGAISGTTSDPNNGMLGLYIGQFPGGGSNTAGLARWAGTSFATPVISGTLAMLATQGIPFNLADPLATLGSVAIQPDSGVGRVLPVTQG